MYLAKYITTYYIVPNNFAYNFKIICHISEFCRLCVFLFLFWGNLFHQMQPDSPLPCRCHRKAFDTLYIVLILCLCCTTVMCLYCAYIMPLLCFFASRYIFNIVLILWLYCVYAVQWWCVYIVPALCLCYVLLVFWCIFNIVLILWLYCVYAVQLWCAYIILRLCLSCVFVKQ